MKKVDELRAWAVNEIEEDLSDRSGIGNEWDNIDDSIQEEVKEEWRKIIDYTIRELVIDLTSTKSNKSKDRLEEIRIKANEYLKAVGK